MLFHKVAHNTPHAIKHTLADSHTCHYLCRQRRKGIFIHASHVETLFTLLPLVINCETLEKS